MIHSGSDSNVSANAGGHYKKMSYEESFGRHYPAFLEGDESKSGYAIFCIHKGREYLFIFNNHFMHKLY